MVMYVLLRLIAVILLVAIIAAIALTMRKRPETTKYQNPAQQILVKRSDRIRLVKMPAEKKL